MDRLADVVAAAMQEENRHGEAPEINGVETIWIVSDNPDVHRRNPQMPSGTWFEHRDQLNAVQRKMREVKGCSVLLGSA